MKQVASMWSSIIFRTSWHIHAHYNHIIYMIYVHIMCSIYLLTCSSVGPLEDACAWPGGPVRKRQRVDSEAETHVKKLRAWANEWPIPGRAVGNLTVFFDR